MTLGNYLTFKESSGCIKEKTGLKEKLRKKFDITWGIRPWFFHSCFYEFRIAFSHLTEACEVLHRPPVFAKSRPVFDHQSHHWSHLLSILAAIVQYFSLSMFYKQKLRINSTWFISNVFKHVYAKSCPVFDHQSTSVAPSHVDK